MIQPTNQLTASHRGPELLKYIPGQKAGDLKTWLQAYRYWNQGGLTNASSMLQLLEKYYKGNIKGDKKALSEIDNLPDLEITPDIGLLHPLLYNDDGTKNYFTSPREYISWRESNKCLQLAIKEKFKLAPTDTAPRVAILLYRKHVITNQKYIGDLITIMEAQGILPASIKIGYYLFIIFFVFIIISYPHIILMLSLHINVFISQNI